MVLLLVGMKGVGLGERKSLVNYTRYCMYGTIVLSEPWGGLLGSNVHTGTRASEVVLFFPVPHDLMREL